MDRWNTVPAMLLSVRTAVLKLAAGLLLLALLSGDFGSALGFLVGTLLSLWQFGSLASSVERAVQMQKQQAEAYAALRYLLRYGVVALALGLVYFTPGVGFAATVIGLFLVKIVIVGYAVREALASGGTAYLRQLARRRVRKEG